MTASFILLAQTVSASGGNSTYLVWGIVLMAMGAALFLTEALLPTGGILGGLSAVAVIGGVVMMFQVNTTLGLISVVATLIAIPFLMMFAP